MTDARRIVFIDLVKNGLRFSPTGEAAARGGVVHVGVAAGAGTSNALSRPQTE
jgi:hypothetical protein